MKNVWIGFTFLLYCLGCSESDSNKIKSAVITDVQNTAVAGQWTITYFFDTDKEETDNFTGYVFEFNTGSGLTASKGSTSHAGTWSVSDDNSGDDNSNGDFDDIDFNIAFASPSDFEELSEDWEIISLTSTKIELRHVSGGNGGTDLLTFEKL